jgi:hypothetical protein
MNDGVALLLERMKTNPEEFAVGEGIIGKWDSLIREYETILDLEDVTLFKQARNKLLQQQFTEKVMEELIDPTYENASKKLNKNIRMPVFANKNNNRAVSGTITVNTPIAGVTQTV